MSAGKKVGLTFRPALVASACAILLSVSGCKIVHDDQLAKNNPSNASSFDPEAYVAGAWDGKVVPLFTNSNIADIAEVAPAIASGLDAAGAKYGHRPATEGSPWTFVVKGKAKVVKIDTTSRAGIANLEITTPGGPKPVTMQIGPVVRGNALRDALPFFSFQSVTNQLEFAQVGRLLNARAMERVKGGVALMKEGGEVAFAGAMTVNKDSDPLLLIPVEVKPVDGGTP